MFLPWKAGRHEGTRQYTIPIEKGLRLTPLIVNLTGDLGPQKVVEFGREMGPIWLGSLKHHPFAIWKIMFQSTKPMTLGVQNVQDFSRV